ncbi:tRNA preQ1(34) S-adenosylmethionine ribosyltransferase-isomerase QueA [Halothiobacillus sp. DCM-1]|uniref:tRNA preQ1(34) S-adenosylmethionine ribosyltransferase-isomerase QueA n=1 Tax=Halothiobacillus sp. DCM-1 TaxID=3112558 RepID=UPI003243E717
METRWFDYTLPESHIALRPIEPRTAARLLVLDAPPATGWQDRQIADLPTLLAPGDLLILNNTRVIPARVFGHKASGGKVEILVERLIDETTAWCHVRASKAPPVGSALQMPGGVTLTVTARDDALFCLELQPTATAPQWLNWLEAEGHVPLPPYIARADDAADRHDYQTVFAQHPGAVAAPTASLHLTEALLQQIRDQGVETAFVTLHVGAGTFQPVKAERLADHTMHQEWMNVPPQTVAAVAAARARGGRILCIGTTALRAIETAARAHPEAAARGEIGAFTGETRLFLYPGQSVFVADALLTNFHLPQSTLLMLVSALAGRERILAAYQHAIGHGYRFFSYGDAMFIPINRKALPTA